MVMEVLCTDVISAAGLPTGFITGDTIRLIRDMNCEEYSSLMRYTGMTRQDAEFEADGELGLAPVGDVIEAGEKKMTGTTATYIMNCIFG